MIHDGQYDLAALEPIVTAAVGQLPADDFAERVAAIEAGDVEAGTSSTAFDAQGWAELWWGGRLLTRYHRSDIIRRDTAGAN